jgi:hypothetical protein
LTSQLTRARSVGVTGTRKGLTAVQKEAVKILLSDLKAEELQHGDCVGADAEIHSLAEALGLRIVIHTPSDTKRRAHCRSDHIEPPKPYLARDRAIVDATALLIATPAEQHGERLRSGTWTTVRYARKAGKRIIIVRPDGTREESA